ncbi:MAG: hypothetical protein ACREMV_00325, partial [Gemmatimonadales bacterium]
MTADEFRAKYHLLEPLTRRGVRSYRARDAAGRVLLVHMITTGSHDQDQRILALTARLGPTERARVVEQTVVDGAPVVVTEWLPAFDSFERWLERKATGPAPVTEGSSDATEPAITALTQPRTPSPPAPPPVARPPVVPPAPPVPPAPAAGPGHFTQLFGPASGAIDEGTDSKPAQSPVIDDFSQVFGPPAGSAAPPEPAAPPAQPTPPSPDATPSDQGPVVRWREGPAPPARPPGTPVIRWNRDAGDAPAPPERHPEPPPQPPGDFTRLFGPAGAGAAPAPAPRERPAPETPFDPLPPAPAPLYGSPGSPHGATPRGDTASYLDALRAPSVDPTGAAPPGPPPPPAPGSSAPAHGGGLAAGPSE